jgi:exopolyphosphatase/guanosine-5'-triphosphate,3'-diphosphate pyrophosphatase
METNLETIDEHVVGFVDIGTNAIRLLVVRINANLSYTIICQEKEVVRLGEGEFKDDTLKPEAIERAILVTKKFADLAKTYGVKKIFSVGTSAVREAKNQTEFLESVEKETGLKIKVISGEEEARLVWLGVSSGVNIGDRKAIFLDLGGGSTEIAIGNQYEYFSLNTLRLGAIRLTSQLIGEGWTAPIPMETYKEIKNYASQKISSIKDRILKYGVRLGFGSSGTVINLAEIANKLFKKNGKNENGEAIISRKYLRKLAPLLCSLGLEERKKLPAINPERADIIVAGAAIIEAFMEELGLEET